VSAVEWEEGGCQHSDAVEIAEEKSSILVFISSRILSLEASFLTIVSLILVCSKIKFRRGGCLKLEELLKLPEYLAGYVVCCF
jgi:hypothetical protein